MTNYERILRTLQEYTNDPEMGFDSLSKAQVETLAEIAADEVDEIVREERETVVTQLQDALDLI